MRRVVLTPTRHRSLLPRALLVALFVLAISSIRGTTTRSQAYQPTGFPPSSFSVVNRFPNLHSQARPITIEPGSPIKKELAAGGTDVFRINVSAGHYLQTTVEHWGVEVEVRAKRPDGATLARMVSPYGFRGVASVSMVAATEGTYTIEVSAVQQTGQSGRYEIKVNPTRAPLEADLNRIKAENLFGRAMELDVTASRKGAIEQYAQAARFWGESGDSYWQAVALHSLGLAWHLMGQRGKAIDAYAQALSIQDSIGDKRGSAFSLKDLGYARGQEGDLLGAAETSKMSLPLWRLDNDVINLAGTLNNLGVIYSNLGEPLEAVNYHSQVLKIREGLRDKSGIAQTYNNIGQVYITTGEPQAALEDFDQALSLILEIAKPGEEDRKRQATFLNNIGYAYYSLGDPGLALDYYEQALEIRKEIKDESGEGGTLSNFGSAYLALGDVHKASTYLKQALPKQNRWGAAYTSISLGDSYLTAGDLQQALDTYNRACESLRVIEDRQGQAAALDKISGIQSLNGNLDGAESSFKQALTLWRAIGDHRGEATTLYGLARLEFRRGNLTKARELIETAINLVEALRTRILNQQLRSTYFAHVRDYYDLEVDLLMQMHKEDPSRKYDQTALQVSERARGRVLLEILSEAHADIYQEVNPSLLEHKRALEQKINAGSNSHFQLLRTKTAPEVMRKVDGDLVKALAEAENVDAEIRKQSPRYAALTKPNPLDLNGIQKLLDPDTILLEYMLGDQHSYLWAVTPTSMQSFRLPERSEIEKAVKAVRDLLADPFRISKTGRNAHTASSLQEADALLLQSSTRVSQMLLSPLASMLGDKRLVIVPDGALQYLPFNLLPAPESKHSPSTGPPHAPRRAPRGQTPAADRASRVPPYRPLVADHEIVNLPSASVVAVLREELAGREVAPREVAVLADPVFDKNDSRLEPAEQAGSTSDLSKPDRDLGRAIRDAAPGAEAALPRLLFSRDEAHAILALTGKEQSRVALDFDASRAMATSEELSQYKIIHFATHGLFNDVHPELSGIVLSLFDHQGQRQPGFIQLHEIYGLRMPAELVVLSACQTGLGKEIRGEGLLGLTRGFMHAGAARIIASMWKVDDEATAALMGVFYKELMIGHKRPADALRAAQIQMWKQKRWRYPYYWAAFTIQGEWR
jgi:CHAT domain-containing protein/Tfp pilus assembly protein PilF